MNKQEAAEALGVTVRTLQRHTAQGKISARQERGKTGMITVFDPDEVERFKRELEGATGYVRPTVTPVTPDSATLGQTALVLGRAGNSAALVELVAAIESARQSARPAVLIEAKLTLSLIEAAQLSGLSRNHLRQAIEDKKLRARIIGRGWRVKRDDLDAYVKKL